MLEISSKMGYNVTYIDNKHNVERYTFLHFQNFGNNLAFSYTEAR